jgi:hypothetical protein
MSQTVVRNHCILGGRVTREEVKDGCQAQQVDSGLGQQQARGDLRFDSIDNPGGCGWCYRTE